MQEMPETLRNYNVIKSFNDAFRQMYPEDGAMPKYVTFVITEDCTLNCSYCYEICKSKNKMTKEVAKLAVDKMFEMSKNETGYINKHNAPGVALEFIGGEPLLEIELMDYIVEYFKFKAITEDHPWALKYMISMTSNGTEYFDERVQDFFEKNKGRISCTITIDGDKDLHDSCRKFPDGTGSYDKVVKACKHVIETGRSTNTKVTLSPENIQYFYNSMLHLHDMGFTSINANCIYEHEWTKEDARIIFDQMKKLADYYIDNGKHRELSCSILSFSSGNPLEPSEDNDKNWCGGDGEMVAFGPDGSIYPCMRYMEMSLGGAVPPMIVGDVFDGFCTNDSQKEFVKCLECIDRRTQSTDECYNCPVASGCGWCSAYNYQEFGTVNKRSTKICMAHKAEVLASNYYYNRLFRYLGMTDRKKLNMPKEMALEIITEDEWNMIVELTK